MRYRDKTGQVVTVYTPNDRAGGFLRSLALAREELASGRSIIWHLFARDFLAQFRQRILGYFWAVLAPFLAIFGFTLMNYAGVLQPGETGIPYPLYVFMGTSVWGCLVGPIGALSSGLQTQSDLILRTNVPKIALAVAALASALYGIAVNLVTLLVLTTFFGVAPSWGALAYPLLILPMIVLGVGIGLAISVVGVIARDISTIVVQLMTLVMYMTPVVYLSATIKNPLLRAAITYNPLSYLVDVPRSVFFLGHTEQWAQYGFASLLSVVVLLLGIRIFYLIQDLVGERL